MTVADLRSKLAPLCGDPTCESFGCTQAAIDAWQADRDADAEEIVRSALGLPRRGGEVTERD